MQSETFKKIETVLFGKLVNGEVDQKELEKPLRKRDIVKVFSLMDKTLNDEVDRNYLKSHLFDQVSRSLDSFLSVEADNVFDEEYRHPDFTLVPKGRRGEAKRILANLVNKAASKPMPLSAAEIAKLKKQFIADFKKAGFLNEKPGCEKTVYSYHFKNFTGQAAVKWKMVNRLEGILKEERIRGVPLLSRASVAKALDEISKSFVGAYNVAFNWDDVVHAATFPDSSLEGVFRLYSPKASS